MEQHFCDNVIGRVYGKFGHGSSLGEMALADDFARSATVLVAEPAELLILTKNRLETINEENPRVGLKTMKGLIKNLSLRLRASSEKIGVDPEGKN